MAMKRPYRQSVKEDRYPFSNHAAIPPKWQWAQGPRRLISFGPRVITDMHDQSASRISGRTRAAVSAMCVRALRITVLKSAGNFARDECHDLNAEKIQRVKCFMHEVRNLLRASNFRTPARPAGFENFWLWSIGGSGSLLRHVRSTPGSRHQSEGSACPLGVQAV